MRLYLLLARVGKVKKGLTPWFQAPVPEAPKRYHGWAWDPAIREWVTTSIRPVEFQLESAVFPKPTDPPRLAQPLYEPGWYWNGRAGVWEEGPLTPQQLSEGIERGPKPDSVPGVERLSEVEGWSYDTMRNEWVATVVFGEPIGFDIPPSLPPQLQFALGVDFKPTDLEYLLFFRKLMDGGFTWDQANDTIDLIRSKWTDLAVAARVAQREAAWKVLIERDVATYTRNLPKADALAVWILVAVGIGFLIGTIAERLVFTDEKLIRQVEPVGTYLLGPENWLYSRNIGMTAKGSPFYSMCAGIGTEFVRHKRFNGKGGIDIIDFPGGFLETGYVFPRFVKYVWEYWELKYVGMLERQGSAFFMLKAGDSDLDAGLFAGTFLPESFWCGDFHWYL